MMGTRNLKTWLMICSLMLVLASAAAGYIFSDAAGWHQPQYYMTIRMADIDGDGADELLGRGTYGVGTFDFDGAGCSWQSLDSPWLWADDWGWNHPEYYETIRTADLDGDGADEILGRGAFGMEAYSFDAATGAWQIRTMDAWLWADSWGWNNPEYYMTIRMADLDGDGAAELLGRGVYGMEAYSFDAATGALQIRTTDAWLWADDWGWNHPQYYETIRTADLDGDGADEILGRGAFGMEAYSFDAATGEWKIRTTAPWLWADEGWEWNNPEYYMTIRTADIDGDGADELLGRGADGMETYSFEVATGEWKTVTGDPWLWADSWGWDDPEYYMTIRTADLDGDGDQELLGRGVFGTEMYDFNTASHSWEYVGSDPMFSDAAGWHQPQYYMTFHTGDIDGDDRDQLLARSTWGVIAPSYFGVRNTTQDRSYFAIQPAIDEAVHGEEIEVSPGCYFQTIDFKGKAIRLYSSGGPEVTTINGNGAPHVVQCVSGEGPGTILEGFTITGGNADGGVSYEDSCGGGMYNYANRPTVINCIFTGNRADYGGGMYNHYSSPRVTNCTFSYNRAARGSGMYNDNSEPNVTNCTFSRNDTCRGGDRGGGMYNAAGNPIVTDCTFSDNRTVHGGGMYNDNSDPNVTNCVFSGNEASYDGGGMYCGNSSPSIINCRFRGNSANYGGGMGNYRSSPSVANCTFNENSAYINGGGVCNNLSSPTLINCTFGINVAGADNGGGSMFNYDNSYAVVTNCIVWGNLPNEITDWPPGSSSTTVTYSCVRGNWGGDGNIDKCPMLRNVTEGDLSLAPWSPCIDAGDNGNVSPDATDIAGSPRLIDGDCDGTVTVDMGAREFRHDHRGDFDSSCLVDMMDFAALAHAWLASPLSDNWDPICDISIPADANVDTRDLKVLAGNWLRNASTPITCDPNRLKDEFGLDGLCAAAVLNAAPCAYVPEDVAQVLHDVGYSARDSYLALSLVCGIADAFTIEQSLCSHYSPEDVAQALHDVGYNARDSYLVLSQSCGITDVFSIEQSLYQAGYPQEEYLEVTALESVRKFAPVLYFDSEYRGLPMSAQKYFETVMAPEPDSPFPGQIKWVPDVDEWDGPCGKPGVECLRGRDECTCGMQNNDFSTLTSGQVPTYYAMISDVDSDVPTGRLRIEYWWFYGFQRPCNSKTCAVLVYCDEDGAHHGDWEHIIVTTDANRTRADAVTYSFHGDWYTRQKGGFEDIDGRPVVYVGRLSHGNWHSDDPNCSCHWMFMPYHCCAYADCRTPNEGTKWYNSYENLVSLRGNSEPWMLADLIGSCYQYHGQEYTVSDWSWGPHISYCNYADIYGCLEWKHRDGCSTHPTTDELNWTIESCDGVGCGTDRCEGLIDIYYDSPVHYDQGWPWEVGSASPPVESAPSKVGGASGSCGSCGASQFDALVRLGDYWLSGTDTHSGRSR